MNARTKLLATLVASTALALVSAAPVQAAGWFVSPTGDDGAAGTSAGTAWADPSQHAGQVGCGDTITAAVGAYPTPYSWSFSTDCSVPKAYITLVCATAGACIHTTSADYQPGILLFRNASYWIVDGFDLQALGQEGSGLAIANNDGLATHVQHHIIVRNNVAHDNACNGIAAAQIGDNISWDYVTFLNNVAYNNDNRSGNNCSGISLYQPQALDHDGGFHNFIVGNVSYHNRACNSVMDTTGNGCRAYTTDGNGIIVDSTLSNVGYDGATLVANNLTLNNGGRGIHGFDSAHVKIIHNTSYHNLQDPYLCATPYAEIDSTLSQQNEVYNNVAYADSTLPCSAAGAAAASGGSAGTASAYGTGATRALNAATSDLFDYNLGFSAQGSGFNQVATDGSTTSVFLAHNTYGDPRFVSLLKPTALTAKAALQAAMFLGAGSPALKTAYPLFSYPTDLLGTPRVSWKANIDRGAIQTSP